jgi:hypothetical protein
MSSSSFIIDAGTSDDSVELAGLLDDSFAADGGELVALVADGGAESFEAYSVPADPCACDCAELVGAPINARDETTVAASTAIVTIQPTCAPLAFT